MRRGGARGLAIFLGGFSLLNVVGGFLDPHFDASIWWIDFRPLPFWLSRVLLLIASLVLLLWSVRTRMSPTRRTITRLCVLLLMGVALINCITYYVLLFQGVIRTDFPFPFSILIVLALIMIYPSAPEKQHKSITLRERQTAILVLALCIVVFPASQIMSFGRTDYRRPAQAAVVFGARAYADGSMSQALTDRTRTAVDLYLDGTVSHLIFSGGPGDGGIHETEAMRRYAVSRGVPDAAMTRDLQGLSTRDTVRNTVAHFQERGIQRVLAVSNYFHLPRIKMAYQRAGFEVYTVPARESYILYQTPFQFLRETAAIWYYYMLPLLGGSEAS